MKPKLRFTIWHLLVVTFFIAAALWWFGFGADFDQDLAKKVPLVIRANLLESRGGSKYHWNTVEVLSVFKNGTSEEIPEKIDVAHYGWNPGNPAGHSTLYLVRYNEGHPEHGWKIYQPD